MKKEELKIFIENLNKEEFEKIYRNNSNGKVAEIFNIKTREINVIISALNIPKKTKEESARIISNTFVNKSPEEKKKLNEQRLSTRNNWSEEYKKQLSEHQRNVRLNFTPEQKQHQLDAFHNTMNNKSEDELLEIRKHRSDATKNYFNRMSSEERNEFSKKMSEVYHNLPEDVKISRKNKIIESYKNTCINKYGTTNILKLDDIKKKIQNTIKDKYGVEYACQLPQCRWSGNDSNVNLSFKQLLIDNNLYCSDDINREFNIGTLSYDFKIDNTLIELNPTATHNSTWSPFDNPKDNKYHFNKTKLAVDNGYRCINIWDWDDIDKVLMLLKPMSKVYARKCEIKLVNTSDTKTFISKYHLQGYAKSDINLGLYYNDELISIMTFGKPRYNKKYEYELIRYCSSMNVVGGAERLFKQFISEYNPKSVISYCDLSKFTGKTYLKLGFTLTATSIGKHWYNPKTNKHITNNLLLNRGYDQLFGTDYGKDFSNENLMLENGFVEIYDCGQATYSLVL